MNSTPVRFRTAHTVWSYDLGASSWGNQELQEYTSNPENARVSDGNPIFMLGSGTPEGNRVEVNLASPVGMIYGEFDPDSVVRENGGVAVFEFSDRENGTFTYTPSEFSSTTWGHTGIEALPLVKLFGIPAPPGFGTPAQR